MGKLILYTDTSSVDISNIFENVTVSGDLTQCTRTMEVNIVSSKSKRVPEIDIKSGQMAEYFVDGESVFLGKVFSFGKSTEGKTRSVTFKDKGIYLKKNSTSYSFKNMTCEDIAKKVCNDFNIEIGEIAKTDFPISRVFIGSDLYSIIMTAYSLASKNNGKKYALKFIGEKLCVYEKKFTSSCLVLEGNSNLMSATYNESLEKMVNRVAIYDKDNNFMKYVTDDNMISLYGVMQRVIKQSKGEDATQKAKDTLFGIEKKVTVENLGDKRCVTGQGIIVREPYTNLYGSFFIDSDTHTFKNNAYFNKLTLNFENIMDKKDVGSLPKE